ncbi:MAG: DUF3467 domain-containing protein [Desulfobacterales bacterium]|nr:DUF3467 domain-containing protein [Desulfobacterales bacterium]
MFFSQKVLRQRTEKIEGRYANYFKVGYNEFEFVIDFGQFYHDDEDMRMHTRIITSPAYMKALLETLGKSIEECERAYGKI